MNRRGFLALGPSLLAAQSRLSSSKQSASRLSIGSGTPQAMAIIIGQSLAAGGGSGTTSISTSQPYANKMFTGGILRPSNISGYTALIESGGKETIASGFANQIAAWQRAVITGDASRDLLMTDWAEDGQGYSVLKKGGSGSQYASSIACVTAANGNLPAGKSRINVGATLCVHGEADSSNFNYNNNLLEWQSDYESDIRAITGQTGVIPMLISQFQSDYIGKGQMLDAAISQPSRIFLVGPKYFLAHSDSLHLESAAYITLGEHYAKAYWQTVVLGQPWSPLRPTSYSRNAGVITLTYTGKVGNLVFDTSTLANPGNYGFTYDDSATHTISVSSVAITDAAAGVVQITLSSTASTGGTLLYAPTSAGGNLRDSDPTVARSGASLYNWACHWGVSNI